MTNSSRHTRTLLHTSRKTSGEGKFIVSGRGSILILLILLSLKLLGQPSPPVTPALAPKVPIKAASFQKAMNEYITKVMIGDNAKPGTYGAFDIKEAKVTGNYSTVRFKSKIKPGDENLANISGIWMLNVNAGVTEGSAALINNNKVSADVSAELKYNIFFKPMGRYFDSDEADYQKQQNDTITWGQAKKDTYKAKKQYLEKLRPFLNAEKVKLENKLIATPGDVELIKDIAKIELEIAEVNGKLLTEFSSSPSDYNDDIDKHVIANNKKVEHKLSQIGVSWIALRYKINNRSFYHFDSTTSFDSQLKQINNNIHEFGIEFNRFSSSVLRNIPSFFVTAGIAYSMNDNFSTLTARNVVDTYVYGAIPANPSNRSAQVKYTAYEGEYLANIGQWRVYSDFYLFIKPKIISAFHIYPELLIRDKAANVMNLGSGFLFPFKNKDDKNPKSAFNIELYFLLKDLSNNTTYASPSNAFTRGQIGLRLSFPINLNLLNTK